MSWALPYVAALQEGKTVQFRPRGNSMKGKVSDGALVTVEPVKIARAPGYCPIKQGDVVLCKVRKKYFLHMVYDDRDGMHDEFLIGNMRRFMNGWTPAKNIFGKVTKIEK